MCVCRVCKCRKNAYKNIFLARELNPDMTLNNQCTRVPLLYKLLINILLLKHTHHINIYLCVVSPITRQQQKSPQLNTDISINMRRTYNMQDH